MAQMKHKAALSHSRKEIFCSDPEWREVVYNKIDITYDVLSIIYNPESNDQESQKEIEGIYEYITKNFGNRIYFYVNKDVEGFKNFFSIEEEKIEETNQILE